MKFISIQNLDDPMKHELFQKINSNYITKALEGEKNLQREFLKIEIFVGLHADHPKIMEEGNQNFKKIV